MKTRIAFACLLAGTLAGPTVVRAADTDADRSHPEAYVKDSAVTVAVKSKLAAEHITSLGNIKVDTDNNGVVYLSGTAHSQEAIDRAIAMARETEHVRSVKSTLTVKKDD